MSNVQTMVVILKIIYNTENKPQTAGNKIKDLKTEISRFSDLYPSK